MDQNKQVVSDDLARVLKDVEDLGVSLTATISQLVQLFASTLRKFAEDRDAWADTLASERAQCVVICQSLARAHAGDDASVEALGTAARQIAARGRSVDHD